jgi:hypothetical protein
MTIELTFLEVLSIFFGGWLAGVALVIVIWDRLYGKELRRYRLLFRIAMDAAAVAEHDNLQPPWEE